MTELNKSEVYSGKYLEVPYEIRHWKRDGKEYWNYYIFLIEKQLPDAFKSAWLKGKRSGRHVFYEYYKSWISNLDWHMGCTFYEKISGFDGADKVIKVGCDYAHLYDEGKYYELSDIESDAHICIQSLIDRTRVLSWCHYCGEYVESVDTRNYCENCQQNENSSG